MICDLGGDPEREDFQAYGSMGIIRWFRGSAGLVWVEFGWVDGLGQVEFGWGDGLGQVEFGWV